MKPVHEFMLLAIELEWRTDDPTYRIKTYEEGEYHTWSEAELARFEARWPIGTPQRTAYALHLYTGQRRSDVCRLTWPENGVFRFAQQKTGAELDIAVHPALAEALAAWPRRGETILYTSYGNAFVVAGYGNFIAAAIRDAGLPEACSSHGLRKATARRLAEAGCTEKQIAAITGHKTLEEVARYTRAASQKKLAQDALAAQIRAEARTS